MILPEAEFLRLDKVVAIENKIEIYIESIKDFCNCPCCYQPSYRVHSCYHRFLKDLPWSNVPVLIHLKARRFFCNTFNCKRKIFTERIPELLMPYSRATNRLINSLRAIGFTSGGEEGCKLVKSLGMHISADSLLRIIRRTPEPVIEPSTIIGVDDWAFKKGMRYGTIIINQKASKVIEILPDRDSETLETWLKEHPEISCVTRDRSYTYKNAIENILPNAVQIADRWHLIKNLLETIQLFLLNHNQMLIETAKSISAEFVIEKSCIPEIAKEPEIKSKKDTETKYRRDKKLQRFNKVKTLSSKGLTPGEIEKKVKISRKTLLKYLSMESLPEDIRHSKLHEFKPYLEKRWQEGCHNTKYLWQEISAQGFKGGYTTVKYFIKRRKREKGKVMSYQNSPRHFLKSSKETAFILIAEEKDLGEKDKRFRNKLFELFPESAFVSKIAKDFKNILKNNDLNGFFCCFEEMMNAGKEFSRFAQGLRNDWKAVQAAVTSKWSNGKTEGHVNRLKLIKRKMYGRAKFDLLRKRVIYC
jgi:transposase